MEKQSNDIFPSLYCRHFWHLPWDLLPRFWQGYIYHFVSLQRSMMQYLWAFPITPGFCQMVPLSILWYTALFTIVSVILINFFAFLQQPCRRHGRFVNEEFPYCTVYAKSDRGYYFRLCMEPAVKWYFRCSLTKR